LIEKGIKDLKLEDKKEESSVEIVRNHVKPKLSKEFDHKIEE